MADVRIAFLSTIGEPGTYCATVYDDIGGDDECRWILDVFGDLPDAVIEGYRVSHGEAIPTPGDADIFILGGSYNSVHDHFAWQRDLRRWFDALAAAGRPLLAVCGGHQLLAHHFGAEVSELADEPMAGTEAVAITDAGRRCGLFEGCGLPPRFHFANGEQVSSLPRDAEVIATHPRLDYAALRYANGWVSTQFHPEATDATLSRSWRDIRPDLVDRYTRDHDGYRFVANFVDRNRG